MAQRMNAKTIELDASHLSIVSKAREVADLIIDATGGCTPPHDFDHFWSMRSQSPTIVPRISSALPKPAR